ncbi:hypothetical protein JL722_8684 [Aureococcus anophagefferens]|nr:hypothetical protein JL722_8684 [Aureococcus anophagefferens]
MAAIAPPLLIDLTSEPAVDPSAFLAKLTPTKSSIKKTWDERVAAAEEARKYFLAGRTIRAACLSKRKRAVPETPSAELLKKIVEKLREAEIRRDIEQEAVKFKAAACRRASPLKFKQAQHAARAIKLRVKLVEATQRRNEHLEAVRSKATRSPPRSPEKRERAAQTFDLGDVCKKLADAGDRRDAILAAKVEKAKKLAEKRRAADGQAAPGARARHGRGLAAAVRALRVTAKSAELAKALDAKHGAAAARRAAAAAEAKRRPRREAARFRKTQSLYVIVDKPAAEV